MRLPQRGRGRSFELQMTAMIDVVFLLLVFFLWTSSFEEPEFDLPSALAEPPAGIAEQNTNTPPPPEAFDELIIVVDQQPDALRLTLNGSPIANVATLRTRLIEIVDIGAQPPVVVDPSLNTPVGTAIEIYDAARSAGLDRVLFAAQPE